MNFHNKPDYAVTETELLKKNQGSNLASAKQTNIRSMALKKDPFLEHLYAVQANQLFITYKTHLVYK